MNNQYTYFLFSYFTCEVTYLLNRYITSGADNKIQIQLQTDFDHLLPQSLTYVFGRKLIKTSANSEVREWWTYPDRIIILKETEK